MLSKAADKLAAAERDLAAGACAEAVSRAYYAVFHAMCAALATRGLSFSSHAQTIGAFNREFVRTGVFAPHVTRIVQQLFDDRHTADYDWLNDIESAVACEDVAAATRLVEECRRYVEQHIRSS